MTERRSTGRSLKPWLPILTGILLTALITFFIHQKNRFEILSYTQQLSQRAENIIKDRFEHFEYGLRGARGSILTAGTDHITRQQFEKYIGSRELEKEFPGALGFGYIVRVSPDEETSFIRHTRADGAPDFQIRTHSPHDTDRFIVRYLYPQQTNKEAIGLDIASEARRRTAALTAARENSTSLTEPVQLLQESPDKGNGALMLLPVFREGIAPFSKADREQQVVGWAFTPLNIEKVLHDLALLLDQAHISLARTREQPAFFETPSIADNILDSASVAREILVIGQRWIMTVSPNRASLNSISYWPLHWIILTGLLLTFLVNQGISLLRIAPLSAPPDTSDFTAGSRRKFYEYLHTTQFRKTGQTTLLVAGILVLTSTLLLYQHHKELIRSDLSTAQQLTLELLKNDAEKYRGDLLFLSKTPPLIALNTIKSQKLAEFDSSSVKQWNARLADIFKAYMVTNPSVYQVRLVEVDNNWQEVVKVERHSKELVNTAAPFLQPTIDKPFIINTLKNPALPDAIEAKDNVHISDISLSPKPDQPAVRSPVWHFSTLINKPDGSPFGIVIIDITINELLKKAVEALPTNTNLYLANKQNQLILHPKKHKTFSIDIIEDNHLINELDQPDKPEISKRLVSTLFEHDIRDLWVSKTDLVIDDVNQESTIRILTSKSRFPTVYELILQTSLVLFLVLLLVIVSIIIHYWTWLANEIKHRDERLTQLQLQKEKEMLRFKVLLDSAPDATLIVDRQGIIQLANEQATRVFGYAREALEGHPIDKLIPSVLRAVHKGHFASYVAAPKTRPMGKNSALFAVGADGIEFPVEISLGSVKQDDEFLISASIRQISERLAIEEQLKIALHKAEKATEAKSAFLANTSHEIRTPLNAILGLTQLLKDETLTEDQEKLVRKIDISGNSLLSIVNDVLDLSKIEANEMTLEAAPVNLQQLLEEITSIFALQARSKALDFNVSQIDPLPEWVLSDSTRIRQILTNLLSNAVKFTEHGGISLSVTPLDSDNLLRPDITRIRFTISDTGIGIPSAAQARLFTPFTQADESTTRQFGGTGLGLSIVRKLTDLLGGSIGFNSKPNGGSSFWVELPLPVYKPEEALSQQTTSADLLVFIIDDSDVRGSALEAVVKSLGWHSIRQTKGAEVTEYLSVRLEQSQPWPDVLFINWRTLSEADWQSVQALAAETTEPFPALILTKTADETDLPGWSQDELIHSELITPPPATTLFNAVNAAVTARTGNPARVMAATQSETIKAKWLADTHILAVDDSEINLEVVEHILKKNGAHVVAVSGGYDALHQLQESANLFDAVLMDVQMPDIDGLETTRRIRDQLKLDKLPVIALTAGALSEEKKRALDAGMNDFITKPIVPSQLIRGLRIAIRQYRGRDVLIQSEFQSEHLITDWPNIDGLNAENSKQLLMGDKGLFFKTLRRLLQDNKNLTDTPLKESELKKNPAACQTLAMQMHKLRSTAGMIGAANIHQAASQCEYLLKSGNSSVTHLTTAIANELKSIQLSGSAALEEWNRSQSNHTETESKATIDQDQLAQITGLLSAKDLQALEVIESHAASIRHQLGAEKYEVLQQQLEALNFAEVLLIFEQLTPADS